MAIDKCLLEIKNVVKDLLTDDEINYVCTSIKEFYNNKKGDTT